MKVKSIEYTSDNGNILIVISGENCSREAEKIAEMLNERDDVLSPSIFISTQYRESF